jgi:hypothetical protein
VKEDVVSTTIRSKITTTTTTTMIAMMAEVEVEADLVVDGPCAVARAVVRTATAQKASVSTIRMWTPCVAI